MNSLVIKEIRLLLPAWIVAVLLALVQVMMRLYDFYAVALLFLGMTVMALTPIGRETSLNTFSSLLAQPAERARIWQTKLVVLVVAFITVFGVWFAAFVFSGTHGFGFLTAENSRNLFVTICLIATATFSGGLWTTLLLRQLAAAFWLTLLVPVSLSGFTGAFLSQNHSKSGVIAVLCVIFAIYSVGGLLFAGRLFFHAQDTGWSGGNLTLPEWKWIFARSKSNDSLRQRSSVVALLKKECLLQQAALTGAAGLLVLHVGIIILRANHTFAKDSAGEVLTSIFWLLWLVLPAVIGSTAVAEERKLGVMESQLSLPVSRRRQFVIKTLTALFLGVFLGGVMPILLEAIGVVVGTHNPIFLMNNRPSGDGFLLLLTGTTAFSTGMVLVTLFASSLARSFLQAIGFAIVIVIGWIMMITLFTSRHMLFYDSLASLAFHSILPLFIAVPTIPVTLLWLSYRNFKSLRDGWTLWWRNLLGLAGATLFIVVVNAAIYNRVWEVFEPAEPAHGPAKLSLKNPPSMQIMQYGNLLVRLPDGRVWFDYLDGTPNYLRYSGNNFLRKLLLQSIMGSACKSLGPEQFVAGSNWVAITAEKVFFGRHVLPSGEHVYSHGFFNTVGIQPNGTLWVSGKSEANMWTANTLRPFGSETNWRQLVQARTSVVLLKNNGTLWRWGPTQANKTLATNKWIKDWARQWPGLRAYKPYQIGTNADWSELFTLGGIFARRTDGHVWQLSVDWKTGKNELKRSTNYDEIISQAASRAGEQVAFVRPNGTLWVLNRYWDEKIRRMTGSGILQVGREDDWRAVAICDGKMVALKSDGSLWQWHLKNLSAVSIIHIQPTQLGIHHDWVAMASMSLGVITLAGDGSLWFWPERRFYEHWTLLKLPKQPELLGNIFGQAH